VNLKHPNEVMQYEFDELNEVWRLSFTHVLEAVLTALAGEFVED
jgi:hypothetical protein